jgi:outer membrane protein OmpA-like peptidoglycan-associated protein
MNAKNFIFVFLLFCFVAKAQDRKPIYFDSGKSALNKEGVIELFNFVKLADTTGIETINIYGYCDDRGNEQYNKALSLDRAETVRNILVKKGFASEKIIIYEGMGEVEAKTDDVNASMQEMRFKNRRVEIVLNKKGRGVVSKANPNRTFYEPQKNAQAGDMVILKNILFQQGRSVIEPVSLPELDKLALYLLNNPTVEIQIRGHVCCMPQPSQYSDAYNKDSQKRDLSLARAKAVHKYLMIKRISYKRMSYVGCGNKFPLGKGDDLDKRVEFLIMKK